MENIRMAYNKKKVDFLNKTISLKKGVIVSASRNYFGDYVTVYSNTNILGSYIDTGTYISTNCYLPNLKIGKYCSIASEVRVIIGNHPTSKFVSTHPAFFSTRKQAGFSYVDEEKYPDEIKYSTKGYLCEIGNDVWIGYGVKILSGVTIGDGAIIGAGSIVTRNIEPYTINVGIPSRIVKKRFSDEHIDFLLKFEWWNKDEKWLNNNAKYFLNIDEFIQKWSIYDI